MEYPRSVGDLDRVDDYFTFTPSIDYKFQDLFSLGVWYQFKDKISNAENNNYITNRTGIKAAFFF